jgi:hypothetical protein
MEVKLQPHAKAALYSQKHFSAFGTHLDHFCGLVVRVRGYISRGPGSIPGATRFSEK